MINYPRKKSLSRIINCSAPGPIHESLKEKLRKEAANRGYTQNPEFKLPECIPDVFMVLNQHPNCIFVGDAKDSTNETIHNQQTLERITKYIDKIDEAISAGDFDYVRFAIVTNDENAIDEWSEKLKELFEERNFIPVKKEQSSFIKQKIDNNSWMTSCRYKK